MSAHADDVRFLARAVWRLQEALAEVVLEEHKEMNRAAGAGPDEWPNRSEYHELGHSSLCIMRQGARDKANLDATPLFWDRIAAILLRHGVDLDEITPEQAA